jgi:ATP-dependent Clp protease ATP-binding subunit ClpB
VRGFSAEAERIANVPSSPVAAAAIADLAVAPPATTSAHRLPLGASLQRYGRDLTEAASQGLLDPLLGRSDVVQRALQILLRRTKNNPCLIGDPGVGKTAIVEGIAQAAASPLAPPALRGRSIVALDLAAVVAGTQYRGAFEERIQGILQDIRTASGRIIVFIDEIHLLVDAGRVEGGMNMANLLKPALARGELRCIGATTVEEYRKYVESDAAFARRLQPVMVEEPTAEEATVWLQGLAPRYAQYHGVVFSDEAIPTAVSLAQRFISDRRLPDSAIDIIDEAASRAQLRRAAGDALAEELEAAVAAAATMEVEKVENLQAVADWRVSGADGRSPEEITRLLEWFGAMPDNNTSNYNADDSLPGGSAAHRQTAEARRRIYLEQFGQGIYSSTISTTNNSSKNSEEVMVASNKLPCPHCGTPTPPVAGAITVSCPKCSYRFLNIPPEKLMLGSSLFLKPLKKSPPAVNSKETSSSDSSNSGTATAASAVENLSLEEKFTNVNETNLPIVGSLEVMEVVAGTAGIPLDQILSVQSSWSTLQKLNCTLLEHVIGQDEAVQTTSAAIRLGITLGQQHTRKRPLAALLFRGPEGVGKRTLATALAESLFGSERSLLRFDLAQSTDKTAVSKLLGSPPGFVGYGEGGALTDAVRRRPHSVIVFENVDLAHPDVLNLLHQILHEGELNDSMGKRANFRNSVVILTTNAHRDRSGSSGGQQFPSTTSSSSAAASGMHQADRRSPSSSQQNANTLSLDHADNHYQQQQLQRRPGSGGSSLEEASRCFNHEILAAVDAEIQFKPLEPHNLQIIARKIVDEASTALLEQGVKLEVSEKALAVAAAQAVSSNFGAGAISLGPVVRSLILAPAVDAALTALVNSQVSADSGSVDFTAERSERKVIAATVDADSNGNVTITLG